VTVTGATAGLQNNTTGNVTSTNGGTGDTASDSTTVVAPPSMSKVFGAASISVGGTTTLTFTITNPNGSTALVGVAFTDTLPAGLTVPDTSASQCGGTLTTTAATGVISLSGATVAAGGTCTFSVTVTGATAGVKLNTTGNVTSTNGGTGDTASDSTTVIAGPNITFNKTIKSGPTPSAGQFVISYEISVSNSGGQAGIYSLTDRPMFDPAGTLATAVSLAAGATDTYDITVTLTVNASSVTPSSSDCQLTQGESGSGLYNRATLQVGEVSTDSNACAPTPVLGITKDFTTNQAFTTDPDVAIGELVTYQVSVEIPSGTFENAKLVDTMQEGLSFVDCPASPGISAGTLSTSVVGGFAAVCANSTPSSPGGQPVDVNREVTFDFGTLINPGGNQTLTVSYRAAVLDSANNRASTSLANSAVFTWGDGQQLGPASKSVVVIEPRLSIQKAASTPFIGIGTPVTYTLTVQHPSGNATPAYNVKLTDPISTVFDPPSAIDCTGGKVPDSGSPFMAPPITPDTVGIFTAVWSELDAGEAGVCHITVTPNSTLLPGQPATNVAYVQWTSLQDDPGQQNGNIFSTWRFFDPNDPAINNYQASSAAPVSPVAGGGAGCKNCFRIPQAGFTPGVLTDLSEVPAVAYDGNMGVSLRIPKMNLNMGIVGVPLVNGVWQVDWLTGVGGWLQGTAFPGLSGNSVIMGHVVTHYGSDGPFAHLDRLQTGDLIFVTAFNRVYVYRVRSVGNVSPDDITVLGHADHPALTLITCSKYNRLTQNYDARLVVRADLVQVDSLR
jgi:LPXTG-site transpeptidase (sortase) family protein